MSIVVTGATGHLGRLVIDHLLDTGTPASSIVATGRRPDRLAELAEVVTTRAVDYLDPESLVAAFAGAQSVLLISGSEVGQRVPQHRNAIEAAKAAGVSRVLYTSSPHADTSAMSLAAEHKATEEILRASGLAFTILRNGWYTENFVPTLEQARVTGEVVTSAGDGRVASAPRADFAAAAAHVLTTDGHDGAVYELTGDTAWDFDELAEAISEVIGAPVTYRRVGSAEHLEILTAAGVDEGTAQFFVGLDGATRDGALAEVHPTLRELLGRPTTPLVEALRAAATV